MLGAGPGVSGVEGELQRVHARGPARRVLACPLVGAVGDLELGLDRGAAAPGPLDLLHQRGLVQLDGVAVVARVVGLAGQVRDPPRQFRRPLLRALQVAFRPLGGRPPGAELAAHFGERAGRRGRSGLERLLPFGVED